MIPATLEHTKNTEVMRELFNLTNNLLMQTETKKWLHVIEANATLVNNIATMIKSRPILEFLARSQDEDVVLGGLMSVLTNILAVRP